jgi:hypothetical protein
MADVGSKKKGGTLVTLVQKLRRIFWVDLGETVKFVGFVEMVVR